MLTSGAKGRQLPGGERSESSRLEARESRAEGMPRSRLLPCPWTGGGSLPGRRLLSDAAVRPLLGMFFGDGVWVQSPRMCSGWQGVTCVLKRTWARPQLHAMGCTTAHASAQGSAETLPRTSPSEAAPPATAAAERALQRGRTEGVLVHLAALGAVHRGLRVGPLLGLLRLAGRLAADGVEEALGLVVAHLHLLLRGLLELGVG